MRHYLYFLNILNINAFISMDYNRKKVQIGHGT